MHLAHKENKKVEGIHFTTIEKVILFMMIMALISEFFNEEEIAEIVSSSLMDDFSWAFLSEADFDALRAAKQIHSKLNMDAETFYSLAIINDELDSFEEAQEMIENIAAFFSVLV